MAASKLVCTLTLISKMNRANTRERTMHILNQNPNFLAMMNTTVVHNENAPWTRIWVGKGHLRHHRLVYYYINTNPYTVCIIRTTCSVKKRKKRTLLTGPSMMSYEMTPSSVIHGRIE